MMIPIPTLRGVIARRVLVNFRVKPEVAARSLPPPFRPRLVRGFAMAGICLIRLENMRPSLSPAALGISSENAAHRIAVEWDEGVRPCEGVFIPRRDTDSLIPRIAGGRIFPGVLHPAAFRVLETLGRIEVEMRTAMVLGGGKNSVFPMLRRLARLGLGGRMAGGRQYVSWIHERDFCRAVEWLLARDDLSGPVNLAAPHPVRQEEMMRLLRRVLRVPFGLPSPRWLLEVGALFLRTETELVVKSRRVIPGRLLASGFEFLFPEIEGAFQDLKG